VILINSITKIKAKGNSVLDSNVGSEADAGYLTNHAAGDLAIHPEV